MTKDPKTPLRVAYEAIKTLEHWDLMRRIKAMEASQFVKEDGKTYFRLSAPPRYTGVGH